MGICELTKKISPFLSTAYDSAIFIFPNLTDLISDPFKTKMALMYPKLKDKIVLDAGSGEGGKALYFSEVARKI